MAIINNTEEWIGNAQISLAEFNPEDESNYSKWYNVINVSSPETNAAFREESSDESTIISSQASTLTRSQNQDMFVLNLQEQLFMTSDDEDEESESCEEQLIEENDDVAEDNEGLNDLGLFVDNCYV